MNNDIVTKARLNAALGTEGNMGFEHNDIVTVDKMNEAIAEGGGGGLQTAKLTATCTNPDVVDIGIYYTFDAGDFYYKLNGEFPQNIGDGLDLLLGDYNTANFVGTYGGNLVNLELESVTGDGEIMEENDQKWLVVHGDCAVTLSYTP